MGTDLQRLAQPPPPCYSVRKKLSQPPSSAHKHLPHAQTPETPFSPPHSLPLEVGWWETPAYLSLPASRSLSRLFSYVDQAHGMPRQLRYASATPHSRRHPHPRTRPAHTQLFTPCLSPLVPAFLSSNRPFSHASLRQHMPTQALIHASSASGWPRVTPLVCVHCT